MRALALMGLVLLLASCTPGGDEGQPTAPSSPSPAVERQALANLLALYQEAVVAEDSDRLHALLAPPGALAQAQHAAASAPRQESVGALTDLTAFQTAMSAMFRQHTVTALTIPPETVEVAPDQSRVTFLEVESTLDPATIAQHTRVYRTSWHLRRTPTGSTATVGIAAVQRDGPLVVVTTPGQVQAGALTRVRVTTPTAGWALASVELDPMASSPGPLHATSRGWHGTFRAAATPPAALPVRLRRTNGEELAIPHPYRLRLASDGVVQPVAGTVTTRLRAIAVAPDGTVWAGGDQGGRPFQVAPGATEAVFVGQVLADRTGRVEDLSVDGLGRLQAVVFAPQRSGVLVLDGAVVCQTVNVLAPAYPLRTASGQPSPPTRAVAAGADALWVHGTDGGVARVADGFRGGQCPPDGVAVRYDTVLRREDGGVPANTVPALLVGRDEALWVGSALGLSRFQAGQTTRVPFAPARSFQGNPATLEAFFQAVAQAIFAAQPVTTVALGGVSFVEAFGNPLLKEDLIFSLVEDGQGRLWVGTLGGGLRRVEMRHGVAQDTLHLTRRDGLASNLVFALAVAPDGAVWAATDEGGSRIADAGSGVTITTFGAVDGLPVPARDVAVDAAGTVWVATDGGLVQIGAAGGVVTGLVQDTAGTPVAGADVLLQGTPLRAVTDAQGEARVTVRAGTSATDLVVAVVTPALADVRPAQFFAVVGEFDTPGDAFSLAAANGVVYIADGGSGVHVIDVQEPTRPVSLHRLPFTPGTLGSARSVALQGDRLYVGTIGFINLHILAIRDPRAADFAADRDRNGVPDVVLRTITFAAEFPSHSVSGIAVQGSVVYALLTILDPARRGVVQVVDVMDARRPRVLSTIELPVALPTGLAVAGEALYIGAGAAGLLVFDVRDPSAPRLIGTMGDPDPSDALDVAVVAGPVVTGQMAYVVERQHDQRTEQDTESVVVLDLQDPHAPVRRGIAPLRNINTGPAAPHRGGTNTLAVAGTFAYIARGLLGLQAIDVRQPATPRLVGAIPTPSLTLSVLAADDVLYATDAIFGLQVIQTPGPMPTDTDGDGIIDFFDVLPTDPTEAEDSDGDRVGNNADPDDDNDGFTDAEEAAATPPTDPLNPRNYPVTAPPATMTTLIVDAASPASVRARNGTPDTPYRSVTEALHVLRSGQAPQVDTLHLRAGRYAPSTTQEIFPLNLSGLQHLTV